MYEHIFKNHNLKPINQFPIFNDGYTAVWPSLLILFCFSIFIYLRVVTPYKLAMTFRSSYNLQAIRQLEREEFNPLNPTSYALSILFLLMFSFYLYKLNVQLNLVLTDVKPFLQYVFFVVVTIVFNGLKYVLKQLVTLISDSQQLGTELFYSNLVINQAMGLVLMPALIVVEFSGITSPYLLISIGAVLFFGFIIKVYRGFIFSLFENHIGLLQVFIYLCALEILPFLVFTKFIITNF